MNLSCFPYFSQCLFKFLEARLHRFSVGCIWVTFSNPLNLYFRSLSLDIDVEKSDGEEASSAAVTLAQLGPNLHKLWSYSCNLTKGRNVSCLAWNKLNPVSSHLLEKGDERFEPFGEFKPEPGTFFWLGHILGSYQDYKILERDWLSPAHDLSTKRTLYATCL